MLRQWLNEPSWLEFLEARRSQRPFACSCLDAPASSLFDWARLDQVLRVEPAPDAIVVRSNALIDVPTPRSAATVRTLFADGIGLVVRRAQTRDAALQTLATQLEREHSVQAHLQLFVTPGGTHGFGWHYDQDDVVILQTVGQKHYYFRQNTLVTRPDEGAPNFALVKSERTPTMQCTMVAGDALYVPRFMWHTARAVEDSFSISAGLVRPG